MKIIAKVGTGPGVQVEVQGNPKLTAEAALNRCTIITWRYCRDGEKWQRGVFRGWCGGGNVIMIERI